MPAYNFKERFAAGVEHLTKCQTIRPKRKRPTKIGDRLYLYTGMRTKQCRKLLETDCKAVKDIEIRQDQILIDRTMRIDSANADRFARADGFFDSRCLVAWFGSVYGFPFKGEVIYW